MIRKFERENNLVTLNNHVINDITYSSVYFSYSPDEKLVLNGVSLRIPGYTLTSIIGAPKTGKSTFLKLLIKLQKVKAGSIRLGKWNVAELKASWLRTHIGYVPQKTALFGDTIRDAVIGDKGAEFDSDVINVCRMVNVHSYIMGLQQVIFSSFFLIYHSKVDKQTKRQELRS